MKALRKYWSRLSGYERILIVIFVVSLPLVNPWVRGDGVGYYAFARAGIIQHNMDFSKDWIEANPSFRMGRVGSDNRILPEQYTSTNHLNNHFSIGPAILWSPFLLATHAGVLLANRAGAHILADGFSRPYIVTIAMATALYGFLALWISFKIARHYVQERFVFLATVSIWFASSLPVYMYFNPSWSHAHSAFAVALFIWYWQRTRIARTVVQWVLLGLIGGFMLDTYYITAVLLLLPFLESLSDYWKFLRDSCWPRFTRLFWANVLFSIALLISFFPTLFVKKVIFGGLFNFGYGRLWDWYTPAFLKTAFSSEHGLFTWTPILFVSVIGLIFLRRYDLQLSWFLIVSFLVYLYIIGSYKDWAGISSFGNRFFVSLTPVFILGLAAFFDWLSRVWHERQAFRSAAAMTSLFIAWNLGLVFQWGMHLIPVRGPVSFREVAYNQVVVVPGEAAHSVKSYFLRRRQLMNSIEEKDMHQLKSAASDGSE
jgi:hypothetical protein